MLTVDLHPSINPLSQDEWQSYFSDQVEPQAVVPNGDYLCIVVNNDDKPILLVPIMLKEVQGQGLIESLVNDAVSLSNDCSKFLGYWFTSLLFGRRIDTDPFGGKFVVTAQSIVPGSALHKVALEQAFRVYTSLTKTMPVSLISDLGFDASTVRATAAENLI